jgi:hypothetical protein
MAIIMGVTCLLFYPVSAKRCASLSRIVALTVLAGALCSAESMTGVVLSNHGGPTGDASGTIDIATGGHVRILNYDRSLQRHFSAESCADIGDIGAIWTVKTRSLTDGGLYAESAACDGGVEKKAHDSWLVVREYLAAGNARPVARPQLFSARWRSSPQGQEYEREAGRLDLSAYRLFGNSGLCVDVVDIGNSGVVRLRAGADCHLTISEEPVDLIFVVRRGASDGRRQIDGIETH